MKRIPRSVRKYIRREKARIRREVLDAQKQEELIKELYQKICPVKPAESGVPQKAEQLNGADKTK
jgi:hypothetical protein